MADQAARLRELAASYKQKILAQPGRPRARVLAVTSGKGGVGKSNVAVNLAYSLISRGKSVILVDADLGLANADILVGTVPRGHLGHFIRGERELTDLVLTAPGNLRLVAGGSGFRELLDLTGAQLDRLIRELARLEYMADYLVLDTGAGLGPAVLRFILAADQVLLVTTPEPTALADAYALVKTVVQRIPGADIKLVLNQVRRPEEAAGAADQFASVLHRFLNARVELVASIPWDAAVPEAVRSQEPFCLRQPQSPAAREVDRLATRLTGTPGRPMPSGFFDRLRTLLTG